jgi:hypothetical protein
MEGHQLIENWREEDNIGKLTTNNEKNQTNLTINFTWLPIQMKYDYR